MMYALLDRPTTTAPDPPPAPPPPDPEPEEIAALIVPPGHVVDMWSGWEDMRWQE